MSNLSIKPEAIIFDWDGTLANTMHVVLAGHNAVRTHFGLPVWGMEEYKTRMAHRSSREIYPQIYGADKMDEAFEVLFGYFDKYHLEALETMPGAPELIAALAQTDIPLGLLSNKRHNILVDEVNHLGWNDHFFGIVGAGFAERDKPDPAPFHAVLTAGDLTGLDPATIWYVGDSEPDMKLAANTGCKAILINSDETERLVPLYEPYGVFESCHALQNVLNHCIDPIQTEKLSPQQ